MNIEFNILSITLLVSSVLVFVISSIIIYKSRDAVRWFALTMLTVAIWALAYSFELSSLSLEDMLFWIKLEYLGISFAPAIWLWFSFKYVDLEKWINNRNFILTFLIPIITYILVLTNEFHHLHYQEVSIATDGPFPLLKITPGPWYYIHTGYFYFILLFGNLLLIRRFKNAESIFRKQAYLILLAGLFPWVINMFYLAGIRPLGQIDLTPFAFVFIYVIVGIGLLKFRLFDIKPLAKDKIIAAMTKGILVLDPDDRIIDFNPAILNILKYQNQSLIGKSISEIFRDFPIIHNLTSRKENATQELKITFGETEKDYMVDFVPLIDKHTNISGMLLQFTDISDKKNIQNQLKYQADELQKMNTLKDKLFTIISHDLKGPISGIGELIKLTENGIVTKEEFFDIIPEISKNINSVSMLLENLLAWSSSQLKGEFVDKKVFNIGQTIEQQIALFQSKLNEKELYMRYERDEKLEVFADKNMIDLVFRNLISNAIKFSNRQDEIYFSANDMGDKIQISVVDNGSGISPENLAKLKDGESFTTPGRNRETGTGLGILLVRDYIQKNGGELEIESILGKGSRFSFSLPKNKKEIGVIAADL